MIFTQTIPGMLPIKLPEWHDHRSRFMLYQPPDRMETLFIIAHPEHAPQFWNTEKQGWEDILKPTGESNVGKA